MKMSLINFQTIVNKTDNRSITVYSCTDHSQYHVLPNVWVPLFKEGADTLCVTNRYWLNFEPPTPLQFMILGIIYLVLMITGCLGNFLVIYFVLSSRVLRTTSNLFILNLAVSDFFMVFKICILNYNMIKQGPSTGRFGCNVFGFLGGLTGTASIMTLAAIGIDRYLVIVHPLDPFKKFSYRQVLGIIALIWLYSLVFSLIPLLGIDGINYSPEGFLVSCSFDYLSDVPRTRIFIVCFFFAAWVFPLILIIFSYITIIVTVSRQEKLYNFNNIKQQKQSQKQKFISRAMSFRRRKENQELSVTNRSSFKSHSPKDKLTTEIKLARIACCIVCLWIVAWTPYAIVALLGISGKKHLISSLSSMIPAMLCKTAACIDPYVYALSHPRFKNEIDKRLLGRFRCCYCFGTNKLIGKGIKKSDVVDGDSVSDIPDRRYSTLYRTQKSFDSGEPSIKTEISSTSRFITFFSSSNKSKTLKKEWKRHSRRMRRSSSLSSGYEMEQMNTFPRRNSVTSVKFMETELHDFKKSQI